MAQIRPAGFSDTDTDDSDFGYNAMPPATFNLVSAKKTVETSLQDAIIHGNLQLLEIILNKDLDDNVNVKLESGWTPLMHACFHAQDKIVEIILNRGADPNLHADSVTPLMFACSNSNADNDTVINIVTNLIEKGSLVNVGDKYGRTPLMRAIASGRVAVVQKLLDNDANIEMRDHQGWTAVFWAVHHNQPEILEILIETGARLKEVDKNNRTILDIALSHDYQSVTDIVNRYFKSDVDEDEEAQCPILDQVRPWYEYYPGITEGKRPDYASEIQHLLYGMSCERLGRIFVENRMDLRTFLLLEEDDMIKLRIDLPFEKNRLKYGLRNFHLKGWNLNSVAGLYARQSSNYSIGDCLCTLGTHLQQVYIVEATLQYMFREYEKEKHKLKFEHPDSPLLPKIRNAVFNLRNNLKSMRDDLNKLKVLLTKMSQSNAPPVNLLKDPTDEDIALGYKSKLIIGFSIGILLYSSRNYLWNMLKK